MDTPTEAPGWASLPALQAAVRSGGSHWFDADAMRFFGTRLDGSRTYGGRVFVASHKPPHGARFYAVHVVDWAGDRWQVSTVGNLGDWFGIGAAHARQIARRIGERDLPVELSAEALAALAAEYGIASV